MNRSQAVLSFVVLSTLAACSHRRSPSDAELLVLLHRAAPPQASQTLDEDAVACLRSWSGDTELLKGLDPKYVGEAGKKTCRTKIDSWLADGERNPKKYQFDDISTAEVVRRIVAQQHEHLAGTSTPLNPRAPIPESLRQTTQSPGLAKPNPNVSLGSSGPNLQAAEEACLKASAAAKEADAPPQLQRFATFCMSRLSALRAQMEQAAQRGASPERLQQMAASANAMAKTAERVLALPKQAAPAQ